MSVVQAVHEHVGNWLSVQPFNHFSRMRQAQAFDVTPQLASLCVQYSSCIHNTAQEQLCGCAPVSQPFTPSTLYIYL